MEESEKIIISHVRQSDKAIQTNDEHSLGVAALAQNFASKFNMGEWGKLMGLYHDLGKQRESFQRYIKNATGIATNVQYHGEDKQHAFIGACEVYKKYKLGNPILPFAICGHHAGLQDYSDLNLMLEKKVPEGIEQPTEKIILSLPESVRSNIQDLGEKSVNHITRMLFSSLVDADYLDTEKFMSPDEYHTRGNTTSIQSLKLKLENYLHNLDKSSSASHINNLRKKIQHCCLEKSSMPVGIYSLSVPTGAGKTLSSMLWAMNHCIANNLDRIIIAIPYTSIVSQTAQILSYIFGQENVLEHHSASEHENIHDSQLRHKLKLATENWDYPIVVTTNVQLFESIYSNKPSKCRKLHNLAKSVLILDEIQTLPLYHFQPIIDALEVYQKLFNTSVLFTTASLPALKGNLTWGYGINCKLRGFSVLCDIVPDEWYLHKEFKRCDIKFIQDRQDYASLANMLSDHDKVLCIVNSRKDAKEIFDLLPKEGIVIHLSRMMCSAHIKERLEYLKKILKENSGYPIRVIATQLIEAGVDIDFPVVYRQEAGLDSILQAAGRCNREGKLTKATTYVFKLENKPFGNIGRSCDARESVITEDWFSPKAMEDYFIQRYSREKTFDKADMNALLYKLHEMCFALAARAFNMIEDNTKIVYVNYGNAAELMDELIREGPRYSIMKKLSQFSVGIYDKDFKTLMEGGKIQEIVEGIFWIPNSDQYNTDAGLCVNNQWIEETLII